MAHLDDTLQIVSRTVRWEGDDRLELDELCADIHKALWELTEVEAVRTALNILQINRNLPTICRCQLHLHLSALTENDEDAIQHFEKAQKQFEKLQTAVYVHGLRDARVDRLYKQVERFEAWIDGSISKPALDIDPSPDYHRPTPFPEEMEEVEEAEKESDSEAEGQNTKGEAVILPTKEPSSAQPDMTSGEVVKEEVASQQSVPGDLEGPVGQQLGRSDATQPGPIESIMPIPGAGVDEAVNHTKQGSTSASEETIVPSTLFPAGKHGVEEVNTDTVATPQPNSQLDSGPVQTRYSNGKSKTSSPLKSKLPLLQVSSPATPQLGVAAEQPVSATMAQGDMTATFSLGMLQEAPTASRPGAASGVGEYRSNASLGTQEAAQQPSKTRGLVEGNGSSNGAPQGHTVEGTAIDGGLVGGGPVAHSDDRNGHSSSHASNGASHLGVPSNGEVFGHANGNGSYKNGQTWLQASDEGFNGGPIGGDAPSSSMGRKLTKMSGSMRMKNRSLKHQGHDVAKKKSIQSLFQERLRQQEREDGNSG